MDVRLRRGYWRLVREHMNANPDQAAGPKAMQDQAQSFACTQGLWRFLANENVTLPQLVVPLREYGRRGLAEDQSGYVLLAHDWSKLAYRGHAAKTDQTQLTGSDDRGYDLDTALLISAENGQPLAPMSLELLAADGVHSTQHDRRSERTHHLQQLFPVMQASDNWNLSARIVHVIDREADAAAHFREWSAAGKQFLVRADFTRKVDWQGGLSSLSDLVQELDQQGLFEGAGEVAVARVGVRSPPQRLSFRVPLENEPLRVA
ncbi:MAG: hypothetical protein R3C01_09670 [Planctomycetaceae bacterium]